MSQTQLCLKLWKDDKKLHIISTFCGGYHMNIIRIQTSLVNIMYYIYDFKLKLTLFRCGSLWTTGTRWTWWWRSRTSRTSSQSGSTRGLSTSRCGTLCVVVTVVNIKLEVITLAVIILVVINQLVILAMWSKNVFATKKNVKKSQK